MHHPVSFCAHGDLANSRARIDFFVMEGTHRCHFSGCGPLHQMTLVFEGNRHEGSEATPQCNFGEGWAQQADILWHEFPVEAIRILGEFTHIDIDHMVDSFQELPRQRVTACIP